ncbi:MAG: small subunit ribosomal protein [Candidatus Parcubacteria bacterium]|jgi:small subunit ribosomal protein S16|nr:small subunit ribosomal protein [Candidatus Parcubacteria bacterium]
MLMIRFQRIGRKNDPAFRIVVLEKSSGPKAGTYVDLVGTYNPKTKAVTLKPERIRDWMGKGAQVSPSLYNLLVKQGVLEGSKHAVVSKKNLEKNKAKEAEAAAAAAPAEAAPAAAEEVTVEAPAEMEAAVEAEAEPAPAEPEAADAAPAEEEKAAA